MTTTQMINPFDDGSSASRTVTPVTQATESSRAVAEVQAALFIARTNPRDQKRAMDRILNACCRPSLAESAIYAYARGGDSAHNDTRGGGFKAGNSPEHERGLFPSGC